MTSLTAAAAALVLAQAVPSGKVSAALQEIDQVGAKIEVSQALLAPGLWFSIRAAHQGEAAAVEQADATSTFRNAAVASTTETLQVQLAALRVLVAAGIFDPLTGR